MARLKHTPIVYPTEHAEFHITTPSGVTSAIFQDKDRALEKFAECPSHWRLIKVILHKRDITPANHDKTAPMKLRMAEMVYFTNEPDDNVVSIKKLA